MTVREIVNLLPLGQKWATDDGLCFTNSVEYHEVGMDSYCKYYSSEVNSMCVKGFPYENDKYLPVIMLSVDIK